MTEEYEKLTMGELRNRAAAGDTEVQKFLDAMYAEMRADYEEMIKNAPPDSVARFFDNIVKVRDHSDTDALRQLAKHQYSMGNILSLSKRRALANSINQKHTEVNAGEDVEKTYDEWWIEQVMFAPLFEELSKPEIEDHPLEDLLPATRRGVGLEVERELTHGTTTDSKEFGNITARDYKSKKEKTDDGREDDLDACEKTDRMDAQAEKSDYRSGGRNIKPEREAEELFIAKDEVREALGKLTPKELRIYLQPVTEDAKNAARKLGMSDGAFRAARSRIIDKIKNSL